MNSFDQQHTGNDWIQNIYVSNLRRKFSRISLSLVLCIFVTYASVFVLQLLISSIGVGEKLATNIYWQWALSLLPLYLFGMPAAYIFLRKVEASPPKESKMEIGELLLLFLIGRFVTQVGSYISVFLVSITENVFKITIADTTSELIEKTPVWLVFLAAVVIAPIAEEFVYRKLIIDRLHVHGEMVAILFSSLIFSLVHGNFFQVFYAFLNGCILGFIYTRTGRLRYTIAFHMATNFLGSIVVLPIMDAQQKLEALLAAGDLGVEYMSLSLSITGYSIAKMALVILGAVILFVNRRKYLPSRYALQPIPKDQTHRIVFLNPGFIAFGVISIMEFALSLL